MNVEIVAQTMFNPDVAAKAAGYEPHFDRFEALVPDFEDYKDWMTAFKEIVPEDADELGEFAGRNCYESWGRPNPKTATNQGYLTNIRDHGHFSVLEHSSVTFYVSDVSRSLLAELSRHRHLSFSVVSQRYVRLNADRTTVHPTIDKYGHLTIEVEGYGFTVREEYDSAIELAFGSYNRIADALLAEGLPKKKALEAARTVLPNLVDSPMVVTGNLRAWLDVLGKRHSVHADEEIQLFAKLVLEKLRTVAPNAFGGVPDEPYGSD